MRNSTITIKQLVYTEDGLGGKIETFKDLKVVGKLFYTKKTKVVTRIQDIASLPAINMYVLYLTTFQNKFEDLISIKKGDKLGGEYGNYRVDDITAHNTKFTITFMEESLGQDDAYFPTDPDFPIDPDFSYDGEIDPDFSYDDGNDGLL